jgi:D-apionolactonase
MRHSDSVPAPQLRLDRRLLDGHPTDPVEPLQLHAGPLSLLFENGGLRYIRYGDREIVRRVYFAVRDVNWGTVPDQISNVQIKSETDSFRVAFDVENKQGEIDFAWHGIITGQPQGGIVFEASGVARSTFRKNRIGFCILHPMDCAGLPVTIRHPDGSAEKCEFPRYIAAENPFLDVVGMRHAVEKDVEVELTFEGDVFETEDQRNWIDASFKTFCTPLSRPYPVEFRAGEELFQRITMELRGKPSEAATTFTMDDGVTLEMARDSVGPLPRIGFALGDDFVRLSAKDVDRLRLLRPAHVRCIVRLSGELELQLARAAQLVRDIGDATAVELVLFAKADDVRVIGTFAELVARQNTPIERWIVFPETGWSTPRELAELSKRAIRQHDLAALVGGGTPANFRELNVNRPPVDELDFITWSMTPEFHAFDNASLVETLAAHATTVASARQFANGLPLVVGPIHFKMQVNPYATGPWPPQVGPNELPTQVDVRQLSLFGAAWTLGSLKYLAESQVHAVTYYELVGSKGLMEREAGSPLPELFPSLPGCVFPLYHVFADLAELSASQVVPIRSSDPLRVEALALTSGKRTRIMLANLTNQGQTVELPVATSSCTIRVLDATNVLHAMQSPESYRQRSEPIATTGGKIVLQLAPFAVACLDLA